MEFHRQLGSHIECRRIFSHWLNPSYQPPVYYTTGQGDSKALVVEEVHIAPHYVAMPLGGIVLIRRGSEYCAVKFTEAWKGKTESARFANYESYYQGDGTGDFQSKNVQFTKDTLVDRISVLGRLYPVPFGHRNLDIKCGPIKLFWSDKGTVYFFGSKQKEGNHGIEFAPNCLLTELRSVGDR